ncbi:ras and EF-hand domain-containing protein isoform X1 [Oryzias latipes]|uniref:RAS and EF-hand domain containing 2 n=2 Tax=Oryzias latipes TaxID=8090 RepID=H2LW85_ORYLA|nr:ras and EF-hand domain-containing protein isoform X1 [Oryzias latipes]
MNRPNLRRLFSACDVNKSGHIEFEDFTVVCRELNVPERDARTLFDKFGASEDGFIDYDRFSSSFQEVSEILDLASFDAGASQAVWEEFEEKMGAEVLLSDSLREQLADLHRAIHASANMTLLRAFEEVIQAVISQGLETKQQCERLETSLKLTEGLNNSQLAEMEEDIQQQLEKTEERVRDEEQNKLDAAMATMKAKHEEEIADLHATVNRLLKSQEASDLHKTKEDTFALRIKINQLSQENEQLRCSLLQANTEVSILHSELDKLKNINADLKAHHEREKEDLKGMMMEYESYSSQIQTLQDVNKKLYDSNDELRSALANKVTTSKRRLSPENDMPARKMKPLQQSTLIIDRSSEQNSHVADWAERYLDSGVSMQMDITESLGSDYDSDDGRCSMETVHASYSEVELSDVKSEAAVSVAPSRASSFASSVRRPLPAFSSLPFEDSMVDGSEPAPMYRLVLAGDAGAGKSSFLLRLTLNEFREDLQSTLGVDFQLKKMLVDGEMTSLQIWDTAGQERFRSIARSYFRKAHGVLLLYDVTSERSFLNVRAWVDQIQDSTDEKLPICIIGNKVDLREQCENRSCVRSLDGEKLAKAYGALFCETSAKEGSNIVEAVLHLAREVKLNVKLRKTPESEVRLGETHSKKTVNSCCGR